MPKPSPSKGNRLNNYCTILLHNKPENQSSNDSRLSDYTNQQRLVCDYESILSHYINQQRLTDSLDLLENLGYSNDSAIRKIQYFQWEGLA